MASLTGSRSLSRDTATFRKGGAAYLFVCRYKKNLKALYVVHPTNFIRIVWNIFKPLIR